MKVLAGSKFLGALLAAVAVGQGVPRWVASQVRRGAADAGAESDGLRPQLGDELGPSWPGGPPLWSDAHGFPLEAEVRARPRP